MNSSVHMMMFRIVVSMLFLVNSFSFVMFSLRMFLFFKSRFIKLLRLIIRVHWKKLFIQFSLVMFFARCNRFNNVMLLGEIVFNCRVWSNMSIHMSSVSKSSLNKMIYVVKMRLHFLCFMLLLMKFRLMVEFRLMNGVMLFLNLMRMRWFKKSVFATWRVYDQITVFLIICTNRVHLLLKMVNLFLNVMMRWFLV